LPIRYGITGRPSWLAIPAEQDSIGRAGRQPPPPVNIASGARRIVWAGARLPKQHGLAPVVGEAQKVERARFIRPLTVRSDRFGSGKRQQARLLRVEFQSVLLEALERVFLPIK